MRVISGTARGHKLKAPKGLCTRPMMDRVKGSLFAMLESMEAVQGRVLDLYAGTGSLGIEALSRGAEWCDFVEQNAGVCQVLRANLAATGFAKRARVIQRTAQQIVSNPNVLGESVRYGVVFMDAPYAAFESAQVVGKLADSRLLRDAAVVAVGHSKRETLADTYGRLRRLKYRRFGDACVSIYRLETTDH